MTYPTIIAKLAACWEKVLCLLTVLLFVLFCTFSAMFFAEIPDSEPPVGRQPTAVRMLPWDALTHRFFHPHIPAKGKANPFAHTLVNHIKPEPPKANPPKEETPKQEPPKQETQQTVQQEPPKKEEPPKPDIVITVSYKGFYIDLTGDPIAFISASSSEDNSTKNMTCKIGTVICGKIKLEGISEENASFRTEQDDAVSIPWNSSHKFSFKQ